MLLMRIGKIKQDMEDYTLTVPISILPGLNADDELSKSEGTVMYA